MLNYTKGHINVIVIILSIVVFLLLSQKMFSWVPNFSTLGLLKKDLVIVELSTIDINQDTNDKYLNELSTAENKQNLSDKNTDLTVESVNNNWKIIIPKISLEADISEGTEKSTMDKYVGHFEDTSKSTGNVGLAAHNRGYPVNYFADIKKLTEGDEIIYEYQNFKQSYYVVSSKIIKDTDWEPLEPTQKNTITLITCVENEPEYRRCIQAIEN